MIIKGQIIEVSDGGKKAKVITSENEIIPNVRLLYPYGDSANPAQDETSQILLFFSLGSKTNAFGIPYNVLLQSNLQPNEKLIGNVKNGNVITFKANGDIEITSPKSLFSGLIDAVGNINTNGVYKVADTQVVGSQGGAVADAVGGAVIDTEARVAINTLLAELRTHGLIL